MDMNNLPPLRPPPAPHSPSGHRSQSSLSQSPSLRSDSSLSTGSAESSRLAATQAAWRSPYGQQQPSMRPSVAESVRPAQSLNNLQSVARQQRTSVDGTHKSISPIMASQQINHRRQHSQGFFEPSLPHATANSAGLSASQIAAQAAMQHISPPATTGSHERKRSYVGLAPINTAQAPLRKLSGDVLSSSTQSSSGLPYHNGTVGGNRLAAASAANAAFPTGRSPLSSPGFPPAPTAFPMAPPADKEPKSKTSKMKLFSKPKNMGLSKDKDVKAAPAMPSPVKSTISSSLLRGGFPNASTTSLVNSISGDSSLYSSANASTSTLVPVTTEKEREKRLHFLSRQKQKFKDDPSQLTLSSAHSNSQATNPDRPQALYNFTPDSPGIGTFQKSMSGFDLRSGARKRKEEKAAAKLDLVQMPSNSSNLPLSDQFGIPSYESASGATSAGTSGGAIFPNDTKPTISAQQLGNIGASMGVAGIGPDDAWPLLKARLLNLFSGEELRTPIEDFNALVGVHIKRCVQLKQPIIIIEDLRELLQTGFGSLSQTLRGVPDDRVVTKLAEMWMSVYGFITPFLQAVFLPIDLEFKGRGHVMSIREAQEFWNSMPESWKSDERPSSEGGTGRLQTLGEELDVRRITLIAFRDSVILPRHESLMAIFSRLALDRINAGASPDLANRPPPRSDPAAAVAEVRPDTAGSLSPRMSSFNSQGSTLLDAASSSSAGRSRATSNTSAGSFGTSMPHLSSPLSQPGAFSATSQPSESPQLPFSDPAKVTATVARMLQCLYVLASCQTGDVGQGVVERLTGALKYNWLGRGRTGRDRRGWVGMRNPPTQRVGLIGA